MEPVLQYLGGKRKEIPLFIQHIPNDFNHYIEPFLGGGAVYFYLEPKRAILNDINLHLITFYNQLKNNYPQMQIQIDTLQRIYKANAAAYKELQDINPKEKVYNGNKDLYYRVRKFFNYPDGSVLIGALYFFLNKTGRQGMMRFNNKGEFNNSFGYGRSFASETLTQRHCELLQGADLYNLDYGRIFDMARVDDFMFLDPPYDCIYTDYGNTGVSFDEEQHRRLANDFRKLTCRALMIIGKTPLIEALYGGYIQGEYHKKYDFNSSKRLNNSQMHLIIKNY